MNLWHVITYAFAWRNWVGNISAELIQLGIVVGIWKTAKRWIVPRVHTVVHKLLAPHLEAHLEAIKAHVTSELERVR